MDPIEARHRALVLATEQAPGGTAWTMIIKNAKMFADFMIDGIVPEEKDTKA